MDRIKVGRLLYKSSCTLAVRDRGATRCSLSYANLADSLDMSKLRKLPIALVIDVGS